MLRGHPWEFRLQSRGIKDTIVDIRKLYHKPQIAKEIGSSLEQQRIQVEEYFIMHQYNYIERRERHRSSWLYLESHNVRLTPLTELLQRQDHLSGMKAGDLLHISHFVRACALRIAKVPNRRE